MSQVHYALEGATVAALQPHRDDLPQDGDLGDAPLQQLLVHCLLQ